MGGKNQPCAFDPKHNPEYYCNDDAPQLVCDGSLDFWLSTDTTKSQIRSDRKLIVEKGPKCLLPEDVPMGKEGQICRPAEPGKKQCDTVLVCVQVMDKAPSLTTTYRDYFIAKYKDKKTSYSENYPSIASALHRFAHITVKNNVDGQTEPNGICVPEPFSKVESCGDAGQKACINELGQDFCFGENRVAYDGANGNICSPKIAIKSKGLIKCTGKYRTCADFCSYNGGKCNSQCAGRANFPNPNDTEKDVGGGLFYQEKIYNIDTGQTRLGPKHAGICDQTYAQIGSDYDINFSDICTSSNETYCCCDVK